MWNLDTNEPTMDAKRFWASIKNTPHNKFSVGEVIEFWTGYSDDIRACATIKAINGDDIYVYDDCYWFPIKDDDKRKITKQQLTA